MSILVAYDGSEVARDALMLARKHAQAYGENLEVVRSVERGADVDLANIQRLEKELDEAIRGLVGNTDPKLETNLLVSSNTAGENIVRHAEIKKSREIVMGVRRRSKVGKFVFGSTSQYVILNAPCPVVTTR
jgi:nucleotide-binding universal stress UspA family protein